MSLLNAALRLTFPEGVGSFAKGVQALADSINRVSGTTVPASRNQSAGDANGSILNNSTVN
jgi:hypothetical protein